MSYESFIDLKITQLIDINGGYEPLEVYISKKLIGKKCTIYGVAVIPTELKTHIVWGPWHILPPLARSVHEGIQTPSTGYVGPPSDWYDSVAAILKEIDAAANGKR